MKGDLYKIIEIGKDFIKLKNVQISKQENDIKLPISNFGSYSLYTKEQMEIGIGDKIKWTRNCPNEGIINKDQLQIKDYSDGKFIAINKSGKKFELNKDITQFIDHSFVTTVFSSQGKTCNNAFISLDSTFDKKTFYTAITRAKYNIQIYAKNEYQLTKIVNDRESKHNISDIEGLKNYIIEIKENDQKQEVLNLIKNVSKSKIEKVSIYIDDQFTLNNAYKFIQKHLAYLSKKIQRIHEIDEGSYIVFNQSYRKENILKGVKYRISRIHEDKSITISSLKKTINTSTDNKIFEVYKLNLNLSNSVDELNNGKNGINYYFISKLDLIKKKTLEYILRTRVGSIFVENKERFISNSNILFEKSHHLENKIEINKSRGLSFNRDR